MVAGIIRRHRAEHSQQRWRRRRRDGDRAGYESRLPLPTTAARLPDAHAASFDRRLNSGHSRSAPSSFVAGTQRSRPNGQLFASCLQRIRRSFRGGEGTGLRRRRHAGVGMPWMKVAAATAAAGSKDVWLRCCCCSWWSNGQFRLGTVGAKNGNYTVHACRNKQATAAYV